jgi:RNA polymerase sigma-70 factor (ECF subfamily)
VDESYRATADRLNAMRPAPEPAGAAVGVKANEGIGLYTLTVSPRREAPDDQNRHMTAAPHTGESTELQLSTVEPERFGSIFDAHFTEMHRYVASRLGPSAADDVVADTFLTAFRNRSRYDVSRGSVRSWLYGIATNSISRQRRVELRALRAMGRQGAERPAESHESRVVSSVTARAMQPALARAIASLNDGDRDVLLLVALADLSHEEVGAALGIPYGTVGSRLSRARKKVRAALGDANPVNEIQPYTSPERA